MKIGGGPKLPAVPATLDDAAKAAQKSVRNLPSVAKTPTPGGSVPVPYPAAGDTFERIDRSRVGNLLQAQAEIRQTEEKIQQERDAAWMSFGTSIVAAATAFGMAGAAAAGAASSAALGAAAASLLATEYVARGAAPGGAGAAAGAVAGAVGDAAGGGASAASGAATAAGADVAAALVAGAAAAAAAGGSAVTGGAAAAAQGALQAITEAAARGGARAVDELGSRSSDLVGRLANEGGSVDPNALVQWVLRESYLQTTEDLRFYAEKVKGFNEQKKAIREHLQELRDSGTGAKGSSSADETRQSQTQEMMRLFQETVNQASAINKKLSETAQAILANVRG